MRHKTMLQIFGIPMLIGILTLLGLVAGLLGDDGWDVAAGMLLAAPLAITAWYWTRPAVPTAKRDRTGVTRRMPEVQRA
ncbi:hypothetical protein U1707_04410 [Sphingomonas sp. PB2P12]|uniref:hypothetical protein n=1 Tax=Sphingomonas sandaracina TaxID=3096157 RepID=UPI002FC8BC11